MSAQSKQDSAEIARIRKAAEDAGVGAQLVAAAKAFSVAPIDLVVNALGTAAPAIIATIGTSVLGAPALAATGVLGVVGTAQGLGIVKSAIYEGTKNALLEAKVPEAQAEARAQLAQEYGGENLDLILGGGAFGGLAAITGVDKALAGPIARKILGNSLIKAEAKKGLKQGALKKYGSALLLEGVPEAIQAGQEKFAENVALQREGFDVPTYRGVAGAAAFEGIIGGALATGVRLITPDEIGVDTKEPKDARKTDDPDERRISDEQQTDDPDERRTEPRISDTSKPAVDTTENVTEDVAKPERGGVELVSDTTVKSGDAKRQGDAAISVAPETTGVTTDPTDVAPKTTDVKAAVATDVAPGTTDVAPETTDVKPTVAKTPVQEAESSFLEKYKKRKQGRFLDDYVSAEEIPNYSPEDIKSAAVEETNNVSVFDQELSVVTKLEAFSDAIEKIKEIKDNPEKQKTDFLKILDNKTFTNEERAVVKERVNTLSPRRYFDSVATSRIEAEKERSEMQLKVFEESFPNITKESTGVVSETAKVPVSDGVFEVESNNGVPTVGPEPIIKEKPLKLGSDVTRTSNVFVAKQEQATAKKLQIDKAKQRAAKKKRNQARRERTYANIEKDVSFSEGLGRKPIFKKLLRPIMETLKNPTLPSSVRKGLYKLLSPRMLQEIVESTRVLIGDAKRPMSLGFLRSAITLVSNTMPKMRLDIIRSAKPAFDLLNQLTGDEARALGKVAVKATTVNVDPSTTKGAKTDPVLAKEYAALSKKAKKAFIAMRDFNKAQIIGLKNDLIYLATRHMKSDTAEGKANIKGAVAEIEKLFKEIDAKGPYFPLSRFGEYWVQIGETTDPDKVFKTFETEKEQKRFIDEFKDDYKKEAGETTYTGPFIDSQTQFTKQILSDPRKNPSAVLEIFTKTIDDMVDNPKFETNTKEQLRTELKDRVMQLGYMLAPSSSLKKNMLHRDSVIGASTDMKRVFSDFVIRSSYQRSRLRHGADYYENLGGAARELNVIAPGLQKDILGEILTELSSRTSHLLAAEPQGVLDKAVNYVTNLAFYWYLTAPASALVNYIGGATVAIPVIGAKYGITNAMAKFLEHSARMASPSLYISMGRDKDGIPIPMLNMEVVAPFEKYKENLSPLQQRLITDMETDLDTSFSHDVTNLSETPAELFTNIRQQGAKLVAALFHNSEKYARTAAALSAFDLAYESKAIELVGKERFKELQKDGLVVEEAYVFALREARDMSYKSLGDFTKSAKSPVFATPVGRVITQFKQYAIMQTFNQLKDFKRMMGFYTGMTPKQLEQQLLEAQFSPEEAKALATEYNVNVLQKEAALATKRFIGTNAMALLVSGFKGAPLYAILYPLIYMLDLVKTEIDVDDEEGEAERLSNIESYVFESLVDVVGEKPALVLTRGLFEYAGLGISDRLSLEPMSMWVRVPAPERTMEDTLIRTVIENLGPSLSIILGATAAFDTYNRTGDFFRAIEQMLPTAVRSGLIALRQQDEGVRVGGATGPLIVPKDALGRSEFIMRLLGIQPTKVAAAQRQKFAKNRIVQKIMLQRNTLLTLHHLAKINTDVDEEIKIRKQIDNFNNQVRDDRLRISIADLTKSADTRDELIKDKNKPRLQGIEDKYVPMLDVPKIGGE